VRLNTTDGYYAREIESLGWELTVCNMLARPESPCRGVLRVNASYGALLADFLATLVPLASCSSVLEVGGGYGVLMRDFLDRVPHLACTMLDISPFLLERQHEALRGRSASFVARDFFSVEDACLAGFDCAILNEIVGDFPTACDIDPDALSNGTDADDPATARVRRIMLRYGIAPPEGARFNFNLGASEAAERLCAAGVPYIFMSEHSCEARVPDALAGLVSVAAPGNPERIPLKGHDEYTIAFSHLVAIAVGHGYRVVRGPLADIVPVDFDGRVRFIMSSNASRSDEHEIIRQFVEDLFKYEYVVFVKG